MSDALHASRPVEEASEVLASGSQLFDGTYVISELLSWSTFGVTYLAADRNGRAVIIKECFPRAFCDRDGMQVVPNSDAAVPILEATVLLFLQDARSLSKIRHPNIAGLECVFEENGTAYLVVEFIDGYDLLEVIEHSHPRPSPEQIRELLKKTLHAMDKIHRAGHLHRDISPENIIVTRVNEPVLIDSGATLKTLANRAAASSEQPLSKSAYAPHEFFVSGSKQDATGDLYALASTFYHLIADQMPADTQARMSAQLSGKPDPYIPLGNLTDEFDGQFCTVLDCALSILPKDRVRSTEEWLRNL